MSGYDISIHCNCLDCRKIICHEQRACVTSCSHIFCLECANVKFSEALVCPACESSLTQSNDIVLIELSPSEEYKTSILAGLSPSVIMDICSRALSFYNYQVSQELCYRKAVQQSLESQLGSRKDRLEAVIRDHKRIVQGEMKKVQALTKENELEKRRNYDLQNEIQVKSSQFTKLQAMYDKLKQRTTGSMIQQSVQDQMTSVRPMTSDKHQTLFQATQSSRSYVQPLQRNRHHQPPIDMFRNTVDSTNNVGPRHYQPQPNHQQMNNVTNTIRSPLFSSHRIPAQAPPPSSDMNVRPPTLDPQQYQHQHQHLRQPQQQPQRPLQHNGWKQVPPPPPQPSRNYRDTGSHIIPGSNRQRPLT